MQKLKSYGALVYSFIEIAVDFAFFTDCLKLFYAAITDNEDLFTSAAKNAIYCLVAIATLGSIRRIFVWFTRWLTPLPAIR